MAENRRRRLASQERKDQARRFAAAYLTEPDVKKAASVAGVSAEIGRKLLHVPEVREVIEEGLSNAARAAGISTEWLLKRLVEVVERCMQAEPLYDREGKETGEYAFDSKGAVKALELLGKHLRAFHVEDKSAATQLGNAVIRVLAQEAQAGRTIKPHADAIETQAAKPETPEKGPSSQAQIPLAPGSVDRAPSSGASESPPVPPPGSV